MSVLSLSFLHFNQTLYSLSSHIGSSWFCFSSLFLCLVLLPFCGVAAICSHPWTEWGVPAPHVWDQTPTFTPLTETGIRQKMCNVWLRQLYSDFTYVRLQGWCDPVFIVLKIFHVFTSSHIMCPTPYNYTFSLQICTRMLYEEYEKPFSPSNWHLWMPIGPD